jgi:CDP-2,3-bis-(O-geranylgeranyl)-sn-glycerol synthase
MHAIVVFVFNAFWYILPAYIGNIAPVLVKWIPRTDFPVDMGKTWRGKRICGDHKTWRGIFVGTLVGAAIALLQGRPPCVGAALAFGNFIGDLIGAFIKRQLEIKPGDKSLLIDSLLGPIFALFAGYVFGYMTISWEQSLMLVISIVPLHLAANNLWYRLHLKSVPW